MVRTRNESSSSSSGTISKLKTEDLPYAKFISLIHKNVGPTLGPSITKFHMTILFWAVIGIWTSIGVYGTSILVDTVAIVYPAWMCYKAEQSRSWPGKWLQYWVIHSLFFLLEFNHTIPDKVPGYFTIKLVILLWCMLSGKGNGSEVIYSIALKPALGFLEKNLGEKHSRFSITSKSSSSTSIIGDKTKNK